MRYHSHLRAAMEILAGFQPEAPLSAFLKNFYRQNRQMGSSDRRTVSGLVYSYFRTGDLLRRFPAEDRLLASWFLCGETPTDLLEFFRPEWNKAAGAAAGEKLALLEQELGELDLLDIFPFQHHLSAGVDPAEYSLSLLRQPDLFIRVREKALPSVREKLEEAAVAFRELPGNCFALDNATRITALLETFRGDFEVQDRSSQLSGGFFRPLPGERWWDACAGSGGKSLLLADLEPSVELYLSDRRASILQNLRQRYREAGIVKYHWAKTDLTAGKALWEGQAFDGILLDAPCSGSGSWGRTPEMMAGFTEDRIRKYRKLQKELARRVAAFLKPGKPLIYITCSVFREENEEVSAYICEELGFRAEDQALLKGYEYRADTLFVSRLVKL